MTIRKKINGNMPPLLSNNHWLMIIMVLFTWYQIGQTINVSSNKSTIKLDNKLEISSDHKLTISTFNKSSLNNSSSNLFLSTTSQSSNINNLNNKILINSTIDELIKNNKNFSKINLNSQRVHFDNIHGGFSLINSTLFNVSSKVNKNNENTNITLNKNIVEVSSLSDSKQQIIEQTTPSTSLKISPLNSKLSLSTTMSKLTSFSTTENKTIVNKSLNSILFKNESTQHQQTLITKENKLSSSLSSIIVTKETSPSNLNTNSKFNLSIDLKPNKQTTKLNNETIISKLITNNTSLFKNNSQINNQTTIKSDLNQFKIISKKDNNKEIVNLNNENDKLCLEDNGWQTTECSESAILNCSYPYTGLTYRFCYSSCQWSKVDTSQCKLAHLAEIHNLILYHVHKHLVDGLYPLVEELSKVVCSSISPILSPIDRIDAFDALNSIFNSVALNLHFDLQEPEQRERELNFVKSILKVTDTLITNQIVFETETEKNSLITFKTTESLLGLRRLIESITRALIVQNEQNAIDNPEQEEVVDRQILQLLNTESNLLLMLIHRTRTGKLLTLFNNEPKLPGANRLPHTALHLETELKDCDAGIAILSVNLQKGGYTQSNKWIILSNPLLVTFFPAISIAADFEQTPTVNVEFTFLDNFIPLSQPVYCVRLTNTSKNNWTRAKCILVKRNTTSAQCACSAIGYITVVSSRGGGRIESDAFGNFHYHQSYAFKLHKPLLISSAASSLIMLLILAFALSSNLLRNLRSARKQSIDSSDQLDRSSIKNNDKFTNNYQEQQINDESNDKIFNQLQAEQLFKEFNNNKQIFGQKTFNSQYCSQAQLNWLILILLFIIIQLFWCTGILFLSDEFTIYKLWNKILNKYRGENQLKPIFISSSWSFNLQTQQTNNLITSFEDSQKYCLNVGLFLHFLFTSIYIWMILNSLHLYRHLKKYKLNDDFKFDSIFNYSSKQFSLNCCTFNHAKSTESLISKPTNMNTSNKNSANNINQISSIKQLIEELNEKDNKDEKELNENNQQHKQQSINNNNQIINRKNNLTNENCPISCSPSKLPKKRAFTYRLNYFIKQIRRHLNTFTYYSISWIIAAFITIFSYKLNPASYETKRYCFMSIEGGIIYSFIVPVSFFIMLNTVLILLALRQYLNLQRVHQQLNSTSVFDSHDLVNNHHIQFNCINKMCKFNFIFRSTYFNINIFVSCLPAFSVFWFFTILALEQQNTAVFQFIFAILNFLFSFCLLLLHYPYVKNEFYFILHNEYFQNTIQDDHQLIRNEFSDEFPDEIEIDEELIICVNCED